MGIYRLREIFYIPLVCHKYMNDLHVSLLLIIVIENYDIYIYITKKNCPLLLLLLLLLSSSSKTTETSKNIGNFSTRTTRVLSLKAKLRRNFSRFCNSVVQIHTCSSVKGSKFFDTFQPHDTQFSTYSYHQIFLWLLKTDAKLLFWDWERHIKERACT